MRNFVVKFLSFFIKVYRLCISPLFPKCCRFYPSCSEYALLALKKHGAFKGCCLTAKRILKCNSLFKGGYDPVP
ncbi:membrane protein insertion efficiency factor YidD [uncultured Treponema sp.]|uniref:membrane protein insertion efficiency factor YidD n=1 Tax=uncultured Treponema sp. TaxID=162155 RepID=UPI00280BA86B|nr:membrane protein insertion efficiency factor YidD [uncultured Treponema sp.]